MTLVRIVKRRTLAPQQVEPQLRRIEEAKKLKEALPSGAPKPEDDELKGWGDMEILGDAPADV